MSDYAAWRISYQTSEQAAKAAYEQTQEQKARIAQLEAQLIAEAARTAEQKLRADRLERQHAMQAKMHAQAAEQLAAVQQGVLLTNEQIEAIEKQVWDLNHFDEVEREGNRKFAHLIAAATHPTPKGLDKVTLLSKDHTGMKVDYRGLLGQVQREIKRSAPGHAEMIRQLQEHMQELGQRWYAGQTEVVDELLQLYCIESGARKAIAAQAKQGGASHA